MRWILNDGHMNKINDTYNFSDMIIKRCLSVGDQEELTGQFVIMRDKFLWWNAFNIRIHSKNFSHGQIHAQKLDDAIIITFTWFASLKILGHIFSLGITCWLSLLRTISSDFLLILTKHSLENIYLLCLASVSFLVLLYFGFTCWEVFSLSLRFPSWLRFVTPWILDVRSYHNYNFYSNNFP